MGRMTAHLDRGWELVARGDLSGAMASAEQTLELDNKSPDAYNLIGFIHASQGDAELALQSYLHAVELDPGCLEAMLNAAELMIHPLLDLDGALRLLDEALECCETTEETYEATMLKIDAMLQNGARDDADTLLSRLPSTPLGNAQLDFLIGRAKLELGHQNEALAFLSAATELEPGHAEAHYHLGLTKEKLSDTTGASLSFLVVRQLDQQAPKPPWSTDRSAFETLIKQALSELPPDISAPIDGAMVIVSDWPGVEVVAEGVDPRVPVMLIDPRTQGEPLRVFVYQRNLERLVADPTQPVQSIVGVLGLELRTQLSRPTAVPSQ